MAPPAATTALKRKHELEKQRDQLGGTRLTLETQVNAIESAHFNAQTMVTMREGAKVLQSIHKQLDVNKVEDTVEDIREQMEITQQIAKAISDPLNLGLDGLDEVCVERLGSVWCALLFADVSRFVQDALNAELAGLEQEVLDERLNGADPVPVASPVSKVAPSTSHFFAKPKLRFSHLP